MKSTTGSQRTSRPGARSRRLQLARVEGVQSGSHPRWSLGWRRVSRRRRHGEPSVGKGRSEGRTSGRSPPTPCLHTFSGDSMGCVGRSHRPIRSLTIAAHRSTERHPRRRERLGVARLLRDRTPAGRSAPPIRRSSRPRDRAAWARERSRSDSRVQLVRGGGSACGLPQRRIAMMSKITTTTPLSSSMSWPNRTCAKPHQRRSRIRLPSPFGTVRIHDCAKRGQAIPTAMSTNPHAIPPTGPRLASANTT